MVEIRIGEMTLRMSRYSNSEMLAEIEGKAGSKRYLVAQPSGAGLYSGVSPQEIATPAANPFAFFDYAFALPVAALRLAFPDGPSSIPASEVQRDVVVESIPVTIRASTSSDGRVVFRLQSPATGLMEGQLSPGLLEPLDGDYRISGWQRGAGPRLQSLKEARSAEKQ
ncbi:MAG: hypothetical protein JWQ01_2066 [Massilia sp.]|nr:hypothetical protein [Massilia sp.]